MKSSSSVRKFSSEKPRSIPFPPSLPRQSKLITKLVIDKNGDLLSDEIRKAIKNELGPINTRVSKGLYRYAVEIDTIVQIIAEVYGFNPKFVEGYRKKAEGHVYKLKGKIDYAALMDPKFAEDEEDE